MEFAIVAEDPDLQRSDPAWDHVVSALNVQITQQAGPAWKIQATVSSYASPGLVPTTATPIVIMQSPANDVEGCHKTDGARASAVVRWSGDGGWSVAASHEIIETMVDPSLDATRDGPDPQGGSQTVQFLVEVCDPCAGITYAVMPGSQIQVSDFCMPAYYTENSFGPFTRCGQTVSIWNSGSIISDSGYVTWCKGDGWYQQMAGSIRGPYTKEELLANALRLGTRGAVDRFPKFGKPPHLRGRHSSKKATRAKSRLEFSKNDALAKWIAELRSDRKST
jgi:hypothetical protein